MRLYEPLWRQARVGWAKVLPTLRFVRHHGLTVQVGPFTGLRYPRSALAHVPALVPRLAGTYELELHSLVEELVGLDPAFVVNIGAGDGYYAAGMALRCPGARVVAFESDPYHARTCSQVARVNRVAERVDVRGLCTAAALAELEAPRGTVVICDCEGDETELIDASRVEWLRHAVLLVETHRDIARQELAGRLDATHSLDFIAPAHRYVGEHELLLNTPGLRHVDWEILMTELRPWPTPWLWAVPRQP